MLKQHVVTLYQECKTEKSVVFSNREKQICLIVPKNLQLGFRHQVKVTIQEELWKGDQPWKH